MLQLGMLNAGKDLQKQKHMACMHALLLSERADSITSCRMLLMLSDIDVEVHVTVLSLKQVQEQWV